MSRSMSYISSRSYASRPRSNPEKFVQFFLNKIYWDSERFPRIFEPHGTRPIAPGMQAI